jgi:hypothetical protein
MDNHELETKAEPAPRRPGRGGGDWLMVMVALAVVVGGGAWWWLRRGAPPPPVPIAAPAPVPAAASPTEPAGPVTPERRRDLLEAISASTAFRAWLAQGELLERWAVVTDNLAEGVSPRAQLRALAPKQGFTTTRRGGRLAISAAAHARFDLFADAVGAIDVAAAVRAYRELHGPLEVAYRALGYPQGSLDRVTAAALKRLAAAPTRDGEVLVEPGGPGADALYLFVDPELERLGQVEKQLLRMGPRNTRIIQAKARQLERALGFSATEAR